MNHPVAFIIGSALFGWLLPEFLLALSTRNVNFEASVNAACSVAFVLLAYGISP